jgi:hypothetical protein
MGSQPEQDVTVTATIKVGAFIYSSHTATGVVKVSIVCNTLKPLKGNYFYVHFKRISAKHLLFIHVIINE